MDFLSKKNSHPLDKSIEFKEEGHIYTVNDDSGFMSVTTWNHSHFPKFDSDKIIGFMMKKEYKPGDEYYGMSAEDIKEKWRKNGESASKLGTKLHYDIECYYNNEPQENDTIEDEYFLKFVEDHKNLERRYQYVFLSQAVGKQQVENNFLYLWPLYEFCLSLYAIFLNQEMDK